MKDLHRVSKLISKLEHFIQELDRTKVLAVYREIDQFNYMEKCESLKLLYQELVSLQEKEVKLKLILESYYSEVSTNWKRDVVWLRRHMQKQHQCVDQERSMC